MVPNIPQRGSMWQFETLFMVIEHEKLVLGLRNLFSSPGHGGGNSNTHSYCSKHTNFAHIPSQRHFPWPFITRKLHLWFKAQRPIEIVLIKYTTLHHISPTLLVNHVTPFKVTFLRRISYTMNGIFSSIVQLIRQKIIYICLSCDDIK